MRFMEEMLLGSVFTDLTKKCENCGHSIVFTTKVDKRICSFCGYAVYKDDKAKFKYKIKEKILKEKKMIDKFIEENEELIYEKWCEINPEEVHSDFTFENIADIDDIEEFVEDYLWEEYEKFKKEVGK